MVSVNTLNANMLTGVPAVEKSRLLEAMIEGMLQKDVVSAGTAHRLGKGMLARSSANPAKAKCTETSYGVFTPDNALELLKNKERLSGFIKAVKRRKNPESFIEVGCGPFPVLSLAAAVYHPEAEITALEINPRSADIAQQCVEMFGLKDRLHVVNADIANYKVDPNTSVAITETFNAGLVEEPGPKIVQLLHAAGVPDITPSAAHLRLEADGVTADSFVDLRTDTHASIEFESVLGIEISAAYYDEQGIVLRHGTDAISKPAYISGYTQEQIDLLSQASVARLTYELGTRDLVPLFEAVAY